MAAGDWFAADTDAKANHIAADAEITARLTLMGNIESTPLLNRPNNHLPIRGGTPLRLALCDDLAFPLFDYRRRLAGLPLDRQGEIIFENAHFRPDRKSPVIITDRRVIIPEHEIGVRAIIVALP